MNHVNLPNLSWGNHALVGFCINPLGSGYMHRDLATPTLMAWGTVLVLISSAELLIQDSSATHVEGTSNAILDFCGLFSFQGAGGTGCHSGDPPERRICDLHP